MAKNGLDKWFAQKWVDIGSKAKRWFFLKMWPFQTKERCKTEVSKMRPTCKSHTDERLTKGECCQTKESSSTRSGWETY